MTKVKLSTGANATYIYWSYFSNGWTRFSLDWWLHWGNINKLLLDIKAFFQRGWQGYADRDMWDAMSYHAGLTLRILRDYRKDFTGVPPNSLEEDYVEQIDSAIDAWEAKVELLNDLGWDKDGVVYTEWRKGLEGRWDKGKVDFDEIYNSLWY